MKRLNLHVSDSQYDWLASQSEEQGITAAEIVRRALDAWISSHTVKNEPLFKQSAHDIFHFGLNNRHATPESVTELQAVVELVVNALRRTASSEVMADFDARLEQSRAPKDLLGGMIENPDSMSS